MKIFILPDLGEGLPDAQIREWYVKVGDVIKTDQPMVAMETAKALVDVPSPHDGKIEKLFGEPGDTIETGQPLVAFEGEGSAEQLVTKDAGTVVGTIEEGGATLEEPKTGKSGKTSATTQRIKATPAVRMLAKQLSVNLEDITPSGDSITAEDVKKAASQQKPPQASTMKAGRDLITLSGVRKAMVLSMTQAHQAIVPVTIVDEADIHQWPAGEDVMIRLIRAIQAACEAVPIVNAYFDGEKMAYQLNQQIHLGLAVDTPEGLYVPVIKDIANQNDTVLRKKIEQFKQEAQSHSIRQEDLHGATILLSNYGAIAGRFATPIMVPPLVTIIGVGRMREAVIPENGKPAVHRVMPISVTTDHRLVTGGETARCLKAIVDSLQEGQ